MARMLASDDDVSLRCGLCSRLGDAGDEVVEAAHGAAGCQPSRAAPPAEMLGRDGLLPQYTLGEQSRELRQRSALLRWRAHVTLTA
jgi:CheY-like chemotaxis protein